MLERPLGRGDQNNTEGSTKNHECACGLQEICQSYSREGYYSDYGAECQSDPEYQVQVQRFGARLRDGLTVIRDDSLRGRQGYSASQPKHACDHWQYSAWISRSGANSSVPVTSNCSQRRKIDAWRVFTGSRRELRWASSWADWRPPVAPDAHPEADEQVPRSIRRKLDSMRKQPSNRYGRFCIRKSTKGNSTTCVWGQSLRNVYNVH